MVPLDQLTLSHLSPEIDLQVGIPESGTNLQAVTILILQFVLRLVILVRRAAAIVVFQLISLKMAPVQLPPPLVPSVANRAITAMYVNHRRLKAGKLMPSKFGGFTVTGRHPTCL